MMMITSGVLTFLAVNFYKMIFTKEAKGLDDGPSARDGLKRLDLLGFRSGDVGSCSTRRP